MYTMTIKDIDKRRMEDIISKGGEISADKDQKLPHTKICIRIPKRFLNRIDNHLANLEISISRSQWILHALQEKLTDEKTS